MAARVIIVLSDANAAFSLPPDDTRQEFVWVDDFSPGEANEYLDKAGFFLNNPQRRLQVFERIGTRPATLKKLVSEGIF